MQMEIDTLLRQLADEYLAEPYGDRPQGFRRVGDRTVVSSVEFSSP